MSWPASSAAGSSPPASGPAFGNSGARPRFVAAAGLAKLCFRLLGHWLRGASVPMPRNSGPS